MGNAARNLDSAALSDPRTPSAPPAATPASPKLESRPAQGLPRWAPLTFFDDADSGSDASPRSLSRSYGYFAAEPNTEPSPATATATPTASGATTPRCSIFPFPPTGAARQNRPRCVTFTGCGSPKASSSFSSQRAQPRAGLRLSSVGEERNPALPCPTLGDAPHAALVARVTLSQ